MQPCRFPKSERNITGGKAYEPAYNEKREPSYIEQCIQSAFRRAYDQFESVYKRSKLKFDNFLHVGSKESLVGGDSTREFLFDSGASCHMVPQDSLSREELKKCRRLEHPIPLTTANGLVIAKFWTYVYISLLEITVPAIILKNAPPLISMGMICRDNGFRFLWDSFDERPFLCKKDGPRLYMDTRHNVPMLFSTARNYVQYRIRSIVKEVEPQPSVSAGGDSSQITGIPHESDLSSMI